MPVSEDDIVGEQSVVSNNCSFKTQGIWQKPGVVEIKLLSDILFHQN